MLEKVAAWSLGFVLIIPLLISSWMVIDGGIQFDDYKSYWTPVLTALVAWIVKGKPSA